MVESSLEEPPSCVDGGIFFEGDPVALTAESILHGVRAPTQGCPYFVFLSLSITASAQRIPSTAALTMPPA